MAHVGLGLVVWGLGFGVAGLGYKATRRFYGLVLGFEYAQGFQVPIVLENLLSESFSKPDGSLGERIVLEVAW